MLSFAGLALSTLTVSLAAAWAAPTGRQTAPPAPLVIEVANVAVFGSLWIAQFLILDRFLFRSADRPASGAIARSVPAGPGPSLTDKAA